MLTPANNMLTVVYMNEQPARRRPDWAAWAIVTTIPLALGLLEGLVRSIS